MEVDVPIYAHPVSKFKREQVHERLREKAAKCQVVLDSKTSQADYDEYYQWCFERCFPVEYNPPPFISSERNTFRLARRKLFTIKK